jgi:hypothetical protein
VGREVAGASELCSEGLLHGGGRKRKKEWAGIKAAGLWEGGGKKREGETRPEERIGPTGLEFLFSISNSFLIPRFESSLNRIQNRMKFYSNLKLKHSFKSKQNASSMKCNKQIFIKPKLI